MNNTTMLYQIEEAVTHGVQKAIAQMSDAQLKAMIMSPFAELRENAVEEAAA